MNAGSLLSMTHLKRILPDWLGRLRRSISLFRADRRHNRQRSRREPSILVVRDLDRLIDYQRPYLDWLGTNRPDIAARLRLARLTPVPPRLDDASLVITWLPDSLRDRFPRKYRWSQRLERRCRARSLPIVNPPSITSDGVKSCSLPIIGGTGVRVARAIPLRSAKARKTLLEQMQPPLIIREDLTHGGGRNDLIEQPEQLRRVDWSQFECPVALEFIDVRSPDGLYRKYRYVLFGGRGIPRHLILSRDWFVHAEKRIEGKDALAEELEYLNRDDPHHEALDRARRALRLDIVAFDYSIDRDGRLVVWEPNPTPTLWAPFNEDPRFDYQRPQMDRIYRELTAYLLERAGMKD